MSSSPSLLFKAKHVLDDYVYRKALSTAPRLFQDGAFTAANLTEAVNHFVTLGEQASLRQLRGLARNRLPNLHSPKVWRPDIVAWTTGERIGWLCRILFEPKHSSPLRPPAFGALSLPHESMPSNNWPLYPLALSGSTYLVLSQGYSVFGSPETVTAYLDYCQENGRFRTTPVDIPSRAEAMRDAEALKNSQAWQAIRWEVNGNHSGSHTDEAWTWQFIMRQAEEIPER